MVYFKITDGEVTRKFKVNPGEITYDQLKERITSLFPNVMDSSKDLHLQYRDSDGDIITISSDHEFQEALAELPESHIWKLHIHGSKASTSREAPRRGSGFSVPSDFFFQHSHRPFGSMLSDPWFGFGRYHHPYHHHPWFSSNPWSHLDREFDRMLVEHSRELNALHNSPDEEATPGTTTAQSSEGEVSATPKGDSTVSNIPGLKVKNFGSWDPKPFEGPFGTGRIIGPVGYYISWNSGDDEQAAADKEQATDDKEQKQETAEASEGMETTEQ